MNPRAITNRTKRRRSGFSLLEVVLALAILVASIAVLGELVRMGTVNAASAQDLTQAQLLCESKMAEISAGLLLPEVMQGVPCEYDPEWLYSIDIQGTEMPGIVALRVTVVQDLPMNKRPAEFSLVRWIQDPGLELPTESVSSETGASAGSASTGAPL